MSYPLWNLFLTMLELFIWIVLIVLVVWTIDLLLMPTTPHKARPIPTAQSPVAGYVGPANDMFGNTAPFNATHHPALSLPYGAANGLPIGLMLVGRHFDEATVLRAAHAYEQNPGSPSRR